MRPIVTPEEMARRDQVEIERGTPAEVLMDRAGRAVARAAIEMLGGRYGKKVAVVCGKGNNGGDGFVAARVLRLEGLWVRCMCVVDPDEISGAAAHHLQLARDAGVSIEMLDDDALRKADLVVDAIFGTGFSGPRDAPSTERDPSITAVDSLNRLKDPFWNQQLPGKPSPRVPLVLSIDIPSGLHGERGMVSGYYVTTDRTVTFGAEKLGVFVTDPRIVGDVEVVDIGIPVSDTRVQALEVEDVRTLTPWRRYDAHKRASGSVLVFAGSEQITGAAALVVRGAFRAGSGYVTIVCTPSVALVVRERCPEAIVRVVEADQLGPGTLDAMAADIEKANAIAVGPGIAIGDEQAALVRRLVREVSKPLVIDADGINVLGDSLDGIDNPKRIVITPHPAEMARLMDLDVRKVEDNRLETVTSAVKRFGCTVLLKGYRTIVGYTSEDAVVFVDRMPPREAGQLREPYTGVDLLMNPTGTPALATAGTGDVLAGLVAAWSGLGISGYDPAARVAAAAYVHGLAGELVGEGAVAWDVAEALPDAIALVQDA